MDDFRNSVELRMFLNTFLDFCWSQYFIAVTFVDGCRYKPMKKPRAMKATTTAEIVLTRWPRFRPDTALTTCVPAFQPPRLISVIDKQRAKTGQHYPQTDQSVHPKFKIVQNKFCMYSPSDACSLNFTQSKDLLSRMFFKQKSNLRNYFMLCQTFNVSDGVFLY